MLRLTVLCVILVIAWAKEECYEIGNAGNMCSGQYCPTEEAYCNEGRECKCGDKNLPLSGQPGLLCAQETDIYTSCLNDAHAYTMNHVEDFHLHSPCWYRLTHVVTHVNTRSRIGYGTKGKCRVYVDLKNERIGGKMFVGSFQLRVTCRNEASTKVFEDNIYRARAYVNAQGKYCYNLQVAKNNGKDKYVFHDDLQLPNMQIDEKVYTFEVDPSTNRVKLYIPTIGVEAQLRPYNPHFNVTEQPWLPGFAVKFEKSKDPKFRHKDKMVSLPAGTILEDFEDVMTPFGSNDVYMTYRAFISDANRKWTTGRNLFAKACRKVEKSFLNPAFCGRGPQAGSAMQDCRFIMDNEGFVACYSDPNSGETLKILDLYSQCLRVMCMPQAYRQCNKFKDKLNRLDDSCKANVPEDMLTLDCDQ